MGGCRSRAANDSDKVGEPLSQAAEPPAAPSAPPVPVAGQRWRGLEVCSVHALGSGSQSALLVVSMGSVVDFEGDAIVNAANESCITGGGVDGAITAAGGPELAAARLALPPLDPAGRVRCPTGEARLTVGGALKAAYCIHAVGPDYNVLFYEGAKSLQQCDALVAKTYQSALDCARERELGTVAFSLISSSIFRGPQSLENVLAAGVAGIQAGAYPQLREAHLVAFTAGERAAVERLCGELLPYAQGTLAAEFALDEVPEEGDQEPADNRA